MRKNGSGTLDIDPSEGQVVFEVSAHATEDVGVGTVHDATSPIMEVIEGDYFEVFGRQGSGGDLDLIPQTMWWQLEVLDPLPAPGHNLTGKQVFRGAHITTSSGVNVPHNESIRMVFDSAVFDTDGFYNGVNGFVIPAGITKVMVHTLINWDDNTSTYENTIFQLSIRRIRDGVDAFQTITRQIGVSVNSSNGRIETVQESHAALIEVQEGDIIELDLFQRDLSAGTSAVSTRGDIGDRAGMYIEVLEDNEPITFNAFVAASGSFTQSLTVSGIPVQLEGGGASDHSVLSNLDFASAGHTGFASEAELLTVSGHLQGEIDASGGVFSGALVAISGASQSITTGVATKLDYDHTEFDTDGYVIPGSGVVLEVPAGKGITHVKLDAQVMWSGDAASGADKRRDLVFLKNFARLPAGNPEVRHPEETNQVVIHQAHSSPLPVTAGDQFSVEVGHNAAGSLDANNSILRTWFSIEDVTPRVGATGATGPAGAGGGSVANALIGADGITVTSGVSEDTLTGFRTEFVNASGTLQSQLDADPFVVNELTAVTGTFTDGLTVGGASTFIDGGSITTATGTFVNMTVGGVDVSATNVQGDITTSGVISRKLGLEHNPIGLWLFDGSLEDSSGNGFDFTVGGGSERYVSTNGLRAAKLDGSTSFIHNVTGTVLERTGDITIEVLLTVDPGSSQRWIVAYSASGETEAVNALYSINYLGSTEQLNWVSEGVSASDDNFNSEAAGIDHLHLLAVVRESDVITVYIDGSQVGASSATLDTPVGGSSSVLEVGSLFLTGGTFLEGSVACVKIIDSALTADEVYTEFERTWGVSEGVNLTLADAITVSSGTFTQSLTISGVSVATSDDLTAATSQVSISGTGLSYFNPDAPPITSGVIYTFNDEFDQNPFQHLAFDQGVPIDSGKWTVFDPDGIDNQSNALAGIFAEGLHLASSTPSADNTWHGYFQDAPTNGDWQIICKVGFGSNNLFGDIWRAGIFVGTDDLVDNPTTADLVTVTLKYESLNLWSASYEQWTDFNSPTATANVEDEINGAARAIQLNGIYLKIGHRASDNRIDTGYSFDGVSFRDLGAGITAPFTITKIGFGKAVGTSETGAAKFSFFRMNALGNFFRNNPAYGRRIPVSGTVNTLGSGGSGGAVDQGQNVLHAQMFS